ncbi:condensation domain-containing protein [Streptomyces sp. NPDC021020]|uniref:condensation domain-containing protein n=1 Tax=Streptomyces sp. NPDC021020 TaxID=3365109 RepID=UPI003795C545
MTAGRTARASVLSPVKRALLERALAERRSRAADGIPRRAGDGPAPLAFAQRGIWFLDRWQPDSGLYGARETLRLVGPLDVTALRRAVDAVVARHVVLRTSFPEDGGAPVQVAAPAGTVPVPLVDLRRLGPREREAAAARLRRAEAEWHFALASGPLLRAVLLRTADDEHLLLLSLHHIVADGWSYALLVAELSAHCTAFGTGAEPQVPELPLQFADFAAWQEDRARAGAFRAGLDQWRERLAGAPAVLDLPADRPRPAVRDHHSGIAGSVLPAEVADGLRRLARREGATLFMTLLAGFHAVLHLWSGEADVVVGCPVAGRSHRDLEPLIGCFVNTVAVRCDTGGDPDFGTLLGRVRAAVLDAQARQDVPFELVVEELGLARSTAHSPVFQAMFAYQNVPRPVWDLAGVAVEPVGLTHPAEAFDLSLTMADDGPAGLTATLSYAADLFDAATAERLLADLGALLADAAADPDRPLTALGGVTPPPRREFALPTASPAAVEPGPSGRARATAELLHGLWSDLLGPEAGEVTDSTDFFRAGGHSLLAVQLVSRLRRDLAVDVPLRAVFEAPTPARLADRIAEALAGGAAPVPPPVRADPGAGPAPLSHAQRRLWFVEQLDRGGAHHNVATALWLDGPLDAGALGRAADAVRARHDMLRTTVRQQAGGPVQVVAPARPCGLPVTDLAGQGTASAEEEALRLAEEEAALPFDLAADAPLRMRLVRLSPVRHLLLVTVHHIATDAWSTELLFEELWAAYAVAGAGEDPALPPLEVQYADYARWEREQLPGVTARTADYWRERLAGAPEALALPYDRPLPGTAVFTAATLPYELGERETAELVAFCLREGVTVFMAVLAAYLMLLRHHCEQDDLVVGSGTAGRQTVEVEPVIGFFTNQLVLRTRVAATDTVREVLARVRETALGAQAHADLPFDRLVELLRPPRRPDRPPLFHVEIEYHRRPDTVPGPAGVTVTPQERHAPTATQDLSLHVVQTPTAVRGALVHNADSFTAATAARMLGELRALLSGVVAAPGDTVADVTARAVDARRQETARQRATAARARFDSVRRRSAAAPPHDARS